VLCLLLACGLGAGLVPTALGQAPAPVVNSPAVPADVSIPATFPSNQNPIPFFDDYSWRTFIALVWPALNGRRGEPDETKTVDGKGPRVFETYKSLPEVFHNDGTAPKPWNEYDDPKFDPCGVQAAFGDLTLGSFSKFGDLGQAGFGTLLGPLVAQNRTYVRFLTAFNQVEFQQILDQKLYLRDNLPNPPASLAFKNGSIDVKSAWVDMRRLPHPERFYVRRAQVLDPVKGTCELIDVGLVGLHIVQKTPSRPQWIWTSFEHVDNVPPAATGAPGTFTFNDGTATPMPANNPLKLPDVLKPPTPPPFNVTRLKDIHPSTKATNKLYHDKLAPNSVWRFYQLVLTQWPLTSGSPSIPGTPANTFPGLPAPNDATAYANTTMETFDQRSVTKGCMACHNFTMQATDFLWSLNDHAFKPSSATPNLLMQNAAFRRLRDALIEVEKLNESPQP